MGSVFQHWAAHSTTFTFNSCLLTWVASLLRRFRSTIMRCSLRTLGVWSSSVRKASAKARGGYTPFTLEHEIRRTLQEGRAIRPRGATVALAKASSFSVGWADGNFSLVLHWGNPTLVCKQNKISCHTCRGSDTAWENSAIWASYPFRGGKHSPSCCDCLALQGSCSHLLSPRTCSWSSPPPLQCQYWHVCSCRVHPKKWAKTHPEYFVPPWR